MLKETPAEASVAEYSLTGMDTSPKETVAEATERAAIADTIAVSSAGASKENRAHVFVVHKRRTRRLAYDIRLEMDGVLKSWAVPRGPSFDPTVKRMAVLVEEYPLDYADFEGVFAEGNSGAGAMIVWDRGTWVPVDEPNTGWDAGKILFELRGFKMRGVWQLIRTKQGDKDWLLIKKPDAYSAEEGTKEVGQESILSGLTVEELAEGRSHADELRAALEEIGAPKKRVRPIDQSPMLAETANEPFSKAGWVFELKYDGYRLIAARDHGEPRLLYRRGSDSTKAFPDISNAIAKLPYEHVILDGEVVVLDDDARPSFQRLQKRVQLLRTQDIQRAAIEHPATFYAFDLLAFEDWDLRGLPLLARKTLLKKLLPKSGPLRFCDHIEERGKELFAHVKKMELEGIIAKKADSIYRAGRSEEWLKVRVDQSGDFAVCGYTLPEGHRTGFGALHLAYFEDGEYFYTGRVGGGFAEKELVSFSAILQKAVRCDAPRMTTQPPGPVSGHVWCVPELVVEVRYKEITHDQLLRQPVFLRLREDKKPEECARPSAIVPSTATAPAPEEATAPISNPQKIFWPDDGYTKNDLLEYYRAVAPWLLPYLRDRMVVLTRYPDGIDGKNFFQKDAPPFVPEWIKKQRMWSDHASREIDYFVCDDEASLLYVANLATIPLHVWSSRLAALDKPDWCIIDLDPKKAPFSSVVTIARALKELCDAIDLPCFVKTSGSSGLHVLLPLGGQCTWEQSRALGELISRVIVEQLPDLATIVRQVEARGDRVYLDYLQNGHGRLLVSPLCVRPLKTAPVSMPLFWEEVGPGLEPRQFNIKNAIPRLKSWTEDPLLPVLSTKVKLQSVLKKLGARMAPAAKKSR